MSPSSKKTLVAAAVMLLVGLGGGWMLSRTWSPQHAAGAPGAGASAGPATGSATGAAAGAATNPATGTATGAAANPAPAGERKVLYWYDPMVPTQKFDRPGKSPFMDMALVPRYADEAGGGTDSSSGPSLAVSTQAMQALGLRVATAEKRVLQPTLEIVGAVGLNEREVSIVQARANGFVERVYARAPGDIIAAGAPLADLLHPEWLAAQREYLAVRAAGDATLTQAARARLALLGMPAGLVERIEAGGQAQAVTTVVAPAGGLIAELMVRQGMTVSAGMTLARINGLGTVWVEAALPEALAATVASGQRAELRMAAFPGEVLRGKVAAILPEASRDTRTLRLRIEVPNPGGRLRAGMFGQVSLLGGGPGAAGREVVTVPAEAAIRTGRRALVYVLDAPGRYRPVEVELGAEVEGHVAVLKGLEAGQQVVASGQFLIDSEASLQGVITRAAPVPTPQGAGSAPAAAPAAASAVRPGVSSAVGSTGGAIVGATTGTAAVATVGSTSRAATAPVAVAGEFITQGRVVEIEAGAITLEHAPVPALKWPAMTMPFQLAQPELARGLRVGDSVVFRFRQQANESVVTAIVRETVPPTPAQHTHGAGSRP